MVCTRKAQNSKAEIRCLSKENRWRDNIWGNEPAEENVPLTVKTEKQGNKRMKPIQFQNLAEEKEVIKITTTDEIQGKHMGQSFFKKQFARPSEDLEVSGQSYG